MAQPNTKRKLVVGIGVAVLLLVAIGEYVPWSVTDESYCVACRACRTERRILRFRLAPVVKENALTAYWRKEIQPDHKHTWRHYHTRKRYLMGWLAACGSVDRVELPRQAEVAVLATFSTSAERLAFARSFLVWSERRESRARNEWRSDALSRIGEAYKQDPNRKDWPQILKRLRITK